MAKWDRPMSRRSYLILQTCLNGAPVFLALEAIASVAIEHPEWDMNEERTWEEWEREMGEPLSTTGEADGRGMVDE